MSQGERFCIFFVQPERVGSGAGHLGDFNRMGQTIAEVIAQTGRKDLSFAFQPAKRTRVNDAIAIPLEIGAVGVGRFREEPAARTVRTKS